MFHTLEFRVKWWIRHIQQQHLLFLFFCVRVYWELILMHENEIGELLIWLCFKHIRNALNESWKWNIWYITMSSMYVRLREKTQTAKIDFNNLVSKSWVKAQENGRFHGSDDIRYIFLSCLVSWTCGYWLLIQIDTFLELLESNNIKVSKHVSLTQNDRIQFLLQFDMLNRSSYCMNAMFQCRTFLKCDR